MNTAGSELRDILIVEDDMLLREVMKIQLKAAGFAIRTAGTGKAALDMIREKHPAVLLLDVGLPDMDGFEVLSRLQRDHGSTDDISIVIHTSLELSRDERERLSGKQPVTWITKTKACTESLASLVHVLADR